MPKRIRVIYLGSTLARTGPVRQLYGLMKYLDRDLFEPAIVTLSPEPSDSFWDDFCSLGVPCSSFELSRITGAVILPFGMREFLRQHPADIVHSFGTRADVLSAVSCSNVSRVSTRHEAFYRQRIIEYGRIRGWLSESLHSLFLRRLDRIACVSESVRRSASGRLLPKTITIKNGVDNDILLPVTSEEKAHIRKRLGLPVGDRIFIFVGHLSTRKDPTTVIRAFLASPASERGLLVLLGDGPLKKKCEELASSSHKILLVGFVNEARDYLQAADVLVSAASNEGLPMAAIEACACGLPVVLSDIAPHSELITLAPQAGILFPINDATALADSLAQVIDADYVARSDAARSIVQNYLNARQMTAEYESLYMECYDEHRCQNNK